MKTKIGVFFGGKSVEHEVSIITALQAIENIDKNKYDIVPIYISKENKMYCGNFIGDINQYKNIDNLLHISSQVTLASYYCYKICKKLKLDYISCSRAAMLHDLFLYDWRKRENGRKGFHAFTHPKTAYENASKLFNLNDKEADIILKHMWPVTFFSFPKYIESFILTLVDKYCALSEAHEEIYNRFCQKKVFRYAYIFLCLLFIRV